MNTGEILQRWYGTLETDWSYTDTGIANTNAVVTVPAEVGKVHYITALKGSFEADNSSGKIELICGGVKIFETFITGNPVDLELNHPLTCEENAAVEATLINNTQNQATIFICGYTKKVE